MMEMYPNYEVFWVDIQTAPENRDNMMRQLLQFVGRDPVDEKAYETYINEWKKVNFVKEETKRQFAVRNKFHDFKYLDTAVEWYDKKKAELDELYS